MEARMLPTTRILSAIADTRDNGADQAKNNIAKADPPVPTMVACFILMPQQAESSRIRCNRHHSDRAHAVSFYSGFQGIG